MLKKFSKDIARTAAVIGLIAAVFAIRYTIEPTIYRTFLVAVIGFCCGIIFIRA